MAHAVLDVILQERHHSIIPLIFFTTYTPGLDFRIINIKVNYFNDIRGNLCYNHVGSLLFYLPRLNFKRQIEFNWAAIEDFFEELQADPLASFWVLLYNIADDFSDAHLMLAFFVFDESLLLLALELEANMISDRIFFLFSFYQIKVLYLAHRIINFLLE